jgi:hypothetical protein
VNVEFPSRHPLSDDEMAAVVVAVELLGARGAPAVEEPATAPAWRFSGRWYAPASRRHA